MTNTFEEKLLWLALQRTQGFHDFCLSNATLVRLSWINHESPKGPHEIGCRTIFSDPTGDLSGLGHHQVGLAGKMLLKFLAQGWRFRGLPQLAKFGQLHLSGRWFTHEIFTTAISRWDEALLKSEI